MLMTTIRLCAFAPLLAQPATSTGITRVLKKRNLTQKLSYQSGKPQTTQHIWTTCHDPQNGGNRNNHKGMVNLTFDHSPELCQTKLWLGRTKAPMQSTKQGGCTKWKPPLPMKSWIFSSRMHWKRYQCPRWRLRDVNQYHWKQCSKSNTSTMGLNDTKLVLSQRVSSWYQELTIQCPSPQSQQKWVYKLLLGSVYTSMKTSNKSLQKINDGHNLGTKMYIQIPNEMVVLILSPGKNSNNMPFCWRTTCTGMLMQPWGSLTNTVRFLLRT